MSPRKEPSIYVYLLVGFIFGILVQIIFFVLSDVAIPENIWTVIVYTIGIHMFISSYLSTLTGCTDFGCFSVFSLLISVAFYILVALIVYYFVKHKKNK